MVRIDSRIEIPASHPHGKELFNHLDWVPYLRIPGGFDHQSCLQEASVLLSHFKPHEEDVLSAGLGLWKCLALRSVDGDPAKTLCNTYYGGEVGRFDQTPYAASCPKTMDFLRKLTDIEACQRIRFMLLEPKSRILVHSDAPNQDVYTSVNIALNMPLGCNFFIDCNPNGTHNPATLKVPIDDGDIMILNIAKYHYVENNSDFPRIHIIVSGPIRFSSEELLKKARLQNGASGDRDVQRQLINKYQDPRVWNRRFRDFGGVSHSGVSAK